MKNEKTLGEKIKYLLDEQGKQAKDLAEYIGVTQAAMSNYLNDKRYININMIGDIAKFLNVTTDTLLLDTEVSYIKLSKKEQQLLNIFNDMSEEKQDAFLKLFNSGNK